MLVSYFVQGHRYNITEEFGCISATYWEVEAILGLLVLPLMLSLISFGYGGTSSS
jgi:pheromone a factor receptor